MVVTSLCFCIYWLGDSCRLVPNLPDIWWQPHIRLSKIYSPPLIQPPSPIHSHINPLQLLLHFPQARHTSHPIVSLAHLQPNGQNLTTASFLTDIRPPVHMGQIVSPSMPGSTAMGGILIHLVKPNLPVNQLFIFSLPTSQPKQSYYTVTWLPLLIQSDTYSCHSSTQNLHLLYQFTPSPLL